MASQFNGLPSGDGIQPPLVKTHQVRTRLIHQCQSGGMLPKLDLLRASAWLTWWIGAMTNSPSRTVVPRRAAPSGCAVEMANWGHPRPAGMVWDTESLDEPVQPTPETRGKAWADTAHGNDILSQLGADHSYLVTSLLVLKGCDPNSGGLQRGMPNQHINALLHQLPVSQRGCAVLGQHLLGMRCCNEGCWRQRQCSQRSFMPMLVLLANHSCGGGLRPSRHVGQHDEEGHHFKVIGACELTFHGVSAPGENRLATALF